MIRLFNRCEGFELDKGAVDEVWAKRSQLASPDLSRSKGGIGAVCAFEPHNIFWRSVSFKSERNAS